MRGRNKTKREQGRTSRGRIAVAAAAGIVIATALVGGLILWSSFSGGGSDGPKTAVIVDQLSLTEPNPAFAEQVRNMLGQAGYLVDDFEGKEVTVEFYSSLPLRDYDVVILRVHSGLTEVWGEATDYISLFTGEPYDDTKYTDAEDAGLVGAATYYRGGESVFGISPDFIASGMFGRFHGTTVIMMGCDGLTYDSAAQAFIRKGAKVVFGWRGRVSAEHTDAATERLLQHLLVEKRTAREAAALTMEEVGPDPDYGSELLAYPNKG